MLDWLMADLPRIKVLGAGNLIMHDEGVGVQVVHRLMERYEFPENVELVDGGTLGLRLLNVITDADHLILIDAVKLGEPPGTLHRFGGDKLPYRVLTKTSMHQVDLIEALTMAALIEDERPGDIVVIGVEPKDIEPWGTDLSKEVAAVFDKLVGMVLEELTRLGVQAKEAESVPGQTG